MHSSVQSTYLRCSLCTRCSVCTPEYSRVLESCRGGRNTPPNQSEPVPRPTAPAPRSTNRRAKNKSPHIKRQTDVYLYHFRKWIISPSESPSAGLSSWSPSMAGSSDPPPPPRSKSCFSPYLPPSSSSLLLSSLFSSS